MQTKQFLWKPVAGPGHELSGCDQNKPAEAGCGAGSSLQPSAGFSPLLLAAARQFVAGRWLAPAALAVGAAMLPVSTHAAQRGGIPHLASSPATRTAGSEVLITDTGSTNTTGYSIAVQTSGLVSYRVTRHSTGNMDALKVKRVPKALAQKLFRDLKAAMPLAQLPITHRFKSASFGTALFVEYNKQRTPDLTSPADARGQAIRADVLGVASALHLKNAPRRPVRMDVPGLGYLNRR